MGKKEYYQKDKVQFVVDLVKNNGIKVTPATQMMCEQFNLTYTEKIGRNYRHKLQKLGVTNNDITNPEETEDFKTAQKREFNLKKKRFIITWGMSETDIHEQFLTNIEAYAKHIKADIHVICGRYRNPNSLEASKRQEKKDKNKSYWHQRLIPYLDAKRQKIHEHLIILSDLKIAPTASTPLTSLNSLTALESCIVGHPRVHLKSLPVLDGYPNKLLLTTGAVTLKNYTDTKTGATSAFHHTLGFAIVELDKEIFHVRQVQCDEDGSFFDLVFKVENGEVTNYKESCPAVVFGDLHLTSEHKDSVNLAFELTYLTKAKQVILHDVMDNYAVSHHEQRNPFVLAKRELDGTWELSKEIDNMVKWFHDRKELQFVSVMSNHNDFIDRWLCNTDWRKSTNKAKYLELAAIVVKGEAPKGVVPYILDKETDNVISLGYNDSYRIGEWELGLHGDKGASGSRGSIMQFKNLNTKTITGHSHSPARENGALVVGTLTELRLGYNEGLSGWMQGIVIIYPNMKATHIHFINNKYTTLI